MGANLKHVPKGFHRKQKHESAALLKLLSKESQTAVETLCELMKSEDDKVRLEASKAVIKFQQDLANDISTDEIQRLIANIRYGGPIQLEVEDDTPTLDFSQVIEPD